MILSSKLELSVGSYEDEKCSIWLNLSLYCTSSPQKGEKEINMAAKSETACTKSANSISYLLKVVSPYHLQNVKYCTEVSTFNRRNTTLNCVVKNKS